MSLHAESLSECKCFLSIKASSDDKTRQLVKLFLILLDIKSGINIGEDKILPLVNKSYTPDNKDIARHIMEISEDQFDKNKAFVEEFINAIEHDNNTDEIANKLLRHFPKIQADIKKFNNIAQKITQLQQLVMQGGSPTKTAPNANPSHGADQPDIGII